MRFDDRADAREKLLRELIEGGYLKTPSLIEAFGKIDRLDFVPVDLERDAYGNYPLSIGHGQTISQPLTVAFMLELLSLESGDKVLDVGAGSGWQTALIAQVVGSKGKVVAIERIPELKKMAEANVGKYEALSKVVTFVLGDGAKGYANEAPYDCIIAAAAARDRIPDAWRGQIRVGGAIVAPVESSILHIKREGENKFRTEEYYGFSFVPLIREDQL